MKDSQKFKEFLQEKYEKKKWWEFRSYVNKLVLKMTGFSTPLVACRRHFSKSKNRRDVEGPWSPGVQAVPPIHGPLMSQGSSHNLPPNARPSRPLVRGLSEDGIDTPNTCKFQLVFQSIQSAKNRVFDLINILFFWVTSLVDVQHSRQAYG